MTKENDIIFTIDEKKKAMTIHDKDFPQIRDKRKYTQSVKVHIRKFYS